MCVGVRACVYVCVCICVYVSVCTKLLLQLIRRRYADADDMSLKQFNALLLPIALV